MNKSGVLLITSFIIFAIIPINQVVAIKHANHDILAQFALLSDSHLNHAKTVDDANFTSHFEKAIEQVNAADVDFVLIAGDLTQSGKPDEFSLFRAEITKFHVPVWYVPGNHDIGNKFSLSGKDEHVTLSRMETYEKQMGPSWFTANCAGVHIICINSSNLGSGFEEEKQMWKFLEKELGTSNKAPTILMMHYPLYLNDENEPSEYWNVEPTPRVRLINLLKKSNVKIVLTGHLHQPVNNSLDGILLVTTPPTSFGIPAGKQPEGWLLVTILKNGKATVTFETIK